MRLYAPLQKIDEEQRMVYGYASTEALDTQGEIIKREAIEAALPGFMRFGNIREMHQPSAVGKAKNASMASRRCCATGDCAFHVEVNFMAASAGAAGSDESR